MGLWHFLIAPCHPQPPPPEIKLTKFRTGDYNSQHFQLPKVALRLPWDLCTGSECIDRMYISDLVCSRIPLLPELWRIIAEIIKQISGIPTAKANLVPSSKSWNAEVAQLSPLFSSSLWSGFQAETSYRTAVEKQKPAFDRTHCFGGSRFTCANL